MSVEVKSRKVRVLSAKITQPQTDRPRPLSGIASQIYSRKQLIQNVYVGQSTQPNRIVSARSHQTKYVSGTIEEEKTHYRPVTRQSRQKQQMAQQITALKQTVNRLVQELSHQRAKFQNMRKKNTKFQKILTLQFQDDKQWSSNKVSSHLVSGIKTMYQSIKEKYEQKCKQYNSLLTKIESTQILEYQIHIRTLEEINKDLSLKMKAFESQAVAMALPSQTQKHATQFVIAQLNIEKERLSAKLKQTQIKSKKVNQSNKQMNMKAEFLQKLIIQKDNNIYALQRKYKKAVSDLQKLKVESDNTNKQLNELRQTQQISKQQYNKSIVELQTNYQQKLETLRSEKDNRIGMLQANNAYVQEMLTQIRKTNSQLNRELQQVKYDKQKNTKNEKQQQATKINIIQKEKEKQSKKLSTNYVSSSGERVAQKADKKYREQAVKKRKIQLNEVIQIADLIKYKLIIQKISIDKLKTMFDFDQNYSKVDDNEWQQKYITMKQVVKILRSRQLNLREQDAILLARYLVEDVQEQYVFCDQLNQNHREVVKSIIRTLIQQYRFQAGKQMDKQAEAVLKNYGNRMKQILKAAAPNGCITKSKFYEVLVSLGVQSSNEAKQYLVAKMALHSGSVNSLVFSRLFDQL